MKKIGSREFFGGLLGGSTGILVTWFHPALLPLGVFVGGIIGFWGKDMIAIFRKSFRQTKEITNRVHSKINSSVPGFLARVCGLPPKAAAVLQRMSAKVLALMISFFGAPARLWKWIKLHPTNLAHALTMSAWIFSIMSIPTVLFLILHYLGEDLGIAVMGFLFAAVGSLMYTHAEIDGSEIEQIRIYYRKWEQLDKYGAFGFFLHEVWKFYRFSLGAALFSTIVIPWICISAMFLIFGIIPITLFLAIARALYWVSTRTEHYLCLSVTMTTTLFFWVTYHESFTDPRILWAVAFMSGIVSGTLAVIARRVLETFYANTKIGQIFTNSDRTWGIIVGMEENPGWIDFSIDNIAGIWFKQSRIARIFRFTCFELPVTQPVRII